MNPKLQASGKKGGMAGKGQSKARPLDPQRARHMALARWHPNNDEHQEDYRNAAQARIDADQMGKGRVSVNEVAQSAQQGTQDAPGSTLTASPLSE